MKHSKRWQQWWVLQAYDWRHVTYSASFGVLRTYGLIMPGNIPSVFPTQDTQQNVLHKPRHCAPGPIMPGIMPAIIPGIMPGMR